jgi:hypothetical protein
MIVNIVNKRFSLSLSWLEPAAHVGMAGLLPVYLSVRRDFRPGLSSASRGSGVTNLATALVSFQGGTPSRLCSVHGPVWPRTLTLFKVNLSGLHGYAGGLNCCLGHFTDSVTFVGASNEKAVS